VAAHTEDHKLWARFDIFTWRLFSPDVSLRHGKLHYEHEKDASTVRSRLAFAGFSLPAVCVLGALGYWAIGNGRWSLEDCIYMVLITSTTVGYGEVIPVSTTDEGRLFTMALLVLGMGVSFYFLSALTAFIIEGDLREVLWRRRMHTSSSMLG